MNRDQNKIFLQRAGQQEILDFMDYYEKKSEQLKNCIKEIEKYINDTGILGFKENRELYSLKEDECGKDILQIIDKYKE